MVLWAALKEYHTALSKDVMLGRQRFPARNIHIAHTISHRTGKWWSPKQVSVTVWASISGSWLLLWHMPCFDHMFYAWLPYVYLMYHLWYHSYCAWPLMISLLTDSVSCICFSPLFHFTVPHVLRVFRHIYIWQDLR